MLLRKRESLHYFTDSELFIERKRENSKKSSMKNSSKGDNLTQKTYKRSNSNHGNFKRLNNEIISKYYLYQKKKEQLSNLINQSCEVIEKSDNQIFQPEKIKKIFKGKYIKNLCQKINIFQNNLRDYCNNENYEFKLDQGHKIWNFSLKSPKSISINQLCKKKLSNNSSLSQNNSNEKPINISNELLKSKVDIIPTIQTTPINIEFQINKNNLYLKSELNKSLQALKRTTLSENKKNNEENYLEKDNKPSSNPVNNIIEKSSVLQSSEVASLENANPVITNSRRNKRTKHNRSSAVCLSSNDIKGILNETKRNDTTPNNSEDKEQKSTHQKFSKEQLERRKLLSRDNYHPSLTTLNSTQFCYNKYYPSISLPSIQRSSQFLQQQWINNRRLNV
ncbi:hypothetical protein BCR36DRAFT_583230 [Piromyces finnis]|uniref:Uncharacterized protein n=1 Tax=Piromyces finnis TaxID=1754191 RepID=A0A1Y1VAB7_9FUNG|nr:hypothetical protein BCR36DRAFT_583230 [Piromyces finnis]|eukprot:ORX50645.1 hypothetical protein BCR36DRAFT_583230 [Piromyces finnis]